jgi:hypothetical protein
VRALPNKIRASRSNQAAACCRQAVDVGDNWRFERVRRMDTSFSRENP